MKKEKQYSQIEIEMISKSAIGKTIADIMLEKAHVFSPLETAKGGLGQIIEKYLFDLEINNESRPDFDKAGIELKVTPYRKLQSGQISAKERLVLNIIDYNTEYKKTFYTSNFWNKNNKIQILWYLWEEEKQKEDYIITHEKLIDLALSEDLNQIKEDWEYIIEQIKKGNAHELSEGDTMYLGACTKGANSKSLRSQPFSDEYAMQRAFAFKNSYMTQLVRKYIGNYEDVEKLLKNHQQSFKSFISSNVNKYIGKTQTELVKIFNINTSSKSINNMLINRMFDVKSNLSETEEFLKANIVPKTIRVNKNGKIKESMSFPYFKYKELYNENWEDSSLKEQLETTKYLFLIFKEVDDDYIFKGIKLWNMPQRDIDKSVQLMWKETHKVISSGNIVKEIKDNRRFTNFPGMKDNSVMHVRPHAKNKNDTDPLPFKDKLTDVSEYTKHCFWINNKYLEKIIEEID